MEVEDRLPRALADVEEDAVVGQPLCLRRLRDEVERPLRLVGLELRDLAEALDVPLRNDEQVDLRRGVDVLDRDRAVGERDVIALAVEPAEEAVLRQRGSPPR